MTWHLEPLADRTGMRVRMSDGRAIGLSQHGDLKASHFYGFLAHRAPACGPFPTLTPRVLQARVSWSLRGPGSG
jgi:hypothetical protein